MFIIRKAGRNECPAHILCCCTLNRELIQPCSATVNGTECLVQKGVMHNRDLSFALMIIGNGNSHLWMQVGVIHRAVDRVDYPQVLTVGRIIRRQFFGQNLVIRKVSKNAITDNLIRGNVGLSNQLGSLFKLNIQLVALLGDCVAGLLRKLQGRIVQCLTVDLTVILSGILIWIIKTACRCRIF